MLGPSQVQVKVGALCPAEIQLPSRLTCAVILGLHATVVLYFGFAGGACGEDSGSECLIILHQHLQYLMRWYDFSQGLMCCCCPLMVVAGEES